MKLFILSCYGSFSQKREESEIAVSIDTYVGSIGAATYIQIFIIIDNKSQTLRDFERKTNIDTHIAFKESLRKLKWNNVKSSL